jgi:organic hydroperoxide reductase OsmC/OhrA
MNRNHTYAARLHWTGNLGSGTAGYRAYSRDHVISIEGKTLSIPCSSDGAFRGNPSRYNPEELLVAALASCHMLWVLHLCADARLVVTAYSDSASGVMVEHESGAGEFTEVVLRPRIELADPGRFAELDAIHHRAHELCFIARSVNFPVKVEPVAFDAAAEPR